MKKKIELMYELFGIGNDLCKECSHYTRYKYRDKPYRKCDVYGVTPSEATDWKASYISCGLFNQPYAGMPIIDKKKHMPRGKNEPEKPIKGQVGMEKALIDGTHEAYITADDLKEKNNEK